MTLMLDRRELLKSLGWGTVAVGAAGAFETVMPAWAESAAAQGTPPRAGIPRIIFSRASLANGIIPHSGETSMELYHNHPHLEKEEIVQPEDIRLQTRLTMRNHKEILDWLGLDWKNVVKMTRYQKRLDESSPGHRGSARGLLPRFVASDESSTKSTACTSRRRGSRSNVGGPGSRLSRSGRARPVKGLSRCCPVPRSLRGPVCARILVSKDMDWCSCRH